METLADRKNKKRDFSGIKFVEDTDKAEFETAFNSLLDAEEKPSNVIPINPNLATKSIDHSSKNSDKCNVIKLQFNAAIEELKRRLKLDYPEDTKKYLKNIIETISSYKTTDDYNLYVNEYHKEILKMLDDENPFADKTNPFVIDNFWNNLELDKTDVEKMKEAKFLVNNMIVENHIGVYIALANGGKTTLFKFLCEELTRKNMKVFYINVDGNPDDLRRHFVHATKHGYTVIAPDVKEGKSVDDVLLKLKTLANSPKEIRLDGQVYIVDTLKKFVDMINKNKLKEIIQMFRALTLKGATVCLLGHANKALDNGKLVYEGTGDLRNDVDDLIYLYYTKDIENKIQDITTEPDKTRATFEPISYRIDFNNNRKVTLLNEVSKVINKEESEMTRLIKDAIENGDTTQKDIITYVGEFSTIGKHKIRNFLIEHSKGETMLWACSKSGLKNNIVYRLF